MEDYKIGDVVELKSGGPKMTVYDVTRGLLKCAWFDGSKDMYATFKFDVVEKKEKATH